MKKKIYVSVIIAFVLFICWYYFSGPVALPKEDDLIEEIKNAHRVTPETIQDTIFINDRHVVVPFVSTNNHYGLSFWVWEKRKWRLTSVFTNGAPTLWELNSKDPSTYYFVWNIHPLDNVDSIDFYVLRERNYRGSGEKETYYPQIQMKKNVSLHEKSYGIIALPEEWISVIDSIQTVDSYKKQDLFWSSIFHDPMIYYGWIPRNKEGNELPLEHTFNGSGFTGGRMTIVRLHLLDENELE